MFPIHGLLGRRVKSPQRFNSASAFTVFQWELRSHHYLSSHVFQQYRNTYSGISQNKNPGPLDSKLTALPLSHHTSSTCQTFYYIRVKVMVKLFTVTKFICFSVIWLSKHCSLPEWHGLVVIIFACHSGGLGSITAIASNFLDDCKKETKTRQLKKMKQKQDD